MWGFIKDILSEPVRLWRGTCPDGVSWREAWDLGCSTPERLEAAFLGLVVYGMALMLLFIAWLLLGALYRKVQYYRLRQHCQHCNEWTLRATPYAQYPECDHSRPCCNDCELEHSYAAFLREVEAQPKVNCVHGHGVMKKLVLEDRIVIDECATCGGVFLDRGEKEKIEGMARNSGYASGRSAGSSNGMMLGLAIGTAIN